MARITKFFNVSRFPVDDHVLTIEIEDGSLLQEQLRYVADNDSSAVSPQVEIPGFTIYRTGAVVKSHRYQTTMGDPRAAAGSSTTYSRFRFGIWLNRTNLDFYFKVFLGLIASVVIALLAFFVKPARMDARFAVGVGAFFGAVANTVATASLVPDTSTFTLTDMVIAAGLVTIFLTMVESTICLHMYHTRGEESLAPQLLDKASFVVFLVAYVTINVAIVRVAML